MEQVIHETIIKLLIELNISGDLSSDRKKFLKQAILSIVEKHYSHSHFQIAAAIVDLIDTCDAQSDNKKQEELLKRILSILNIKS